MVSPPVDAVEVRLNIDQSFLTQEGISGSMTIGSHTTLLVDIFQLIQQIDPNGFGQGQDLSKEAVAGKTLLLAEDSEFFRDKFKALLAGYGFKVITAQDGRAAWDILEQDSGKIDLVITDVEMPNMDGFELTRKIKEDARFSHLKVIALTSLSSPRHMEEGNRAGIDAYLTKFDTQGLLSSIQKGLTQDVQKILP